MKKRMNILKKILGILFKQKRDMRIMEYMCFRK